MKNTTRFEINVRQYNNDVLVTHDGQIFIVRNAAKQHVEDTLNEECSLHFDFYAVMDMVYEDRWDYYWAS